MQRLSPRSAQVFIILGFLAVLAVTLTTHAHLAHLAPYVDEGDMAMDARIIHRGGLMYRDVFNEKGPGLYWLVAGLFEIFGDRLIVLRYASAGGTALTLLLLFAFGIRWQRPLAGLLAAAGYAIAHLFFLGFIYQAEAPITPLLMMALFLLATEHDRPPSPVAIVFAGLALFGATTVKQTSWLLVAAATLSLACSSRRTDTRTASKRTALFLAAVAAPWLIVLAASWNYLDDFLRGYLFPLLEYDTEFYTYRPNRLEFFLELPVWWMVIVSFIALPLTRLARADKWLLGLMLAAVLATMFPALFPYHFAPLLALSCLGTALALTHLPPAYHAWRWIAPAGLLALTTIAAYNVTGQQLKNQFFAPPHPADAAIVRDIQTLAAPDETIFVFPFNSLYYYQADRAHPGRHGFFLPWVIPAHVLPEVLAEFERRPPALVLYVYFDKCTTNGARPKDYVEPLLARLLDDYRIREIYPNNVAMLERLTSGMKIEPGERCLLEKLLYTDLDCRGVVPPLAQWRQECGM
ncbi:MAG TPA: glycosyltransferase family 39 protein [bacterium]|nr:glycosyltransferase family 39 protein [bacterium]